MRQAMEDAGLQPGQVDQVILVGGSTRIPAVQEQVKEITGKEPHKGINPDEVVAVGAAIQAGVLAGEVKDVLLLDVTPLSLGIETKGGVFTKLIERNTTIPTRKSEVFTTADDNQGSVEIKVYQGEREIAAYNKIIGNFQLVGIPPAPRGVPQIEVAFDIDANGIVNVGAKDLGTGKEQRITITASSGLSEAEIEQMMEDAESHAEEDKRRREEADVRNNADNLVYSIERSLKDVDGKVDPNTKLEIEQAIKETKEALAGGDIEEIKRKQETLMTASHKLSEVLYSQASSSRGQLRRGHGHRRPGGGRRGSRRRGRGRGAQVTIANGRAAAGGVSSPAVSPSYATGGLASFEQRGEQARPGAGKTGRPQRRVEEAQGHPTDPASTGTGRDGRRRKRPRGRGDRRRGPVLDGGAGRPPRRLEAARQERDQYLDALRRLKAEFENSRKRQERERPASSRWPQRGWSRSFSPCWITWTARSRPKGISARACRVTRDQLAEVLGDEGLLPVASDGQPFDPNVHEAVMGQPSEEHEEGTIIQTFQRGYVLNGKPIRVAKVVVARQV